MVKQQNKLRNWKGLENKSMLNSKAIIEVQ